MKIINYKKHIICYDEYIFLKKKELKEFIEKECYKDVFLNFKEDIVLVLGGDGTILRAVKEFYRENKSFLGINFGCKGFLLNSKKYINKDFNYEKRIYNLLEIETKINGKIKKEIAFNEIDIRAGEGKMISLYISLREKQNLSIEGDGIIISTQAGSTSYNSSLGGPIIPHNIPAFVITPKAPWNPKGHGPIIIDENELLKIKNLGRKNSLEVYLDGNLFLKNGKDKNLELKIGKADEKINLIIASDYKNIWDNKVLQEQGFYIE